MLGWPFRVVPIWWSWGWVGSGRPSLYQSLDMDVQGGRHDFEQACVPKL